MPFYGPNRVISTKFGEAVIAMGHAIDSNCDLIRSGFAGLDRFDGRPAIEFEVEFIVPGQPLVSIDNQTAFAIREINGLWR